PSAGNDTRAFADFGSISATGPSGFASSTHEFWLVSNGGVLRGGRRVAATARSRRPTKRRLANGSLHHPYDRRGACVDDRSGICISRSRTANEEYDHELLAAHGFLWKSAGDIH